MVLLFFYFKVKVLFIFYDYMWNKYWFNNFYYIYWKRWLILLYDICRYIRELFIKVILFYCIFENEKSCSFFVILSLCVLMYF